MICFIGPLLQSLNDLLCQFEEGYAIGAGGKSCRLSAVAAFADALHNRNLTEERHAIFFGHPFSAALSEDIVFMVRKFLRGEPCHILDKAEYRFFNALVAEHVHAFFHVRKGDVLRGRDNHCALHREACR